LSTEPIEAVKPAESTRAERLRAVVTHGAIILMDLVPFLNVVIVFLVWAVSRQKSAFIRHHAMEALNFNIVWSLVFAAVHWGMSDPYAIVIVRVLDVLLAIAAIRMAYIASQGRIANYYPRIQLVR